MGEQASDDRATQLVAELERIDGERHSSWALFASLIGAALLVAGGYIAIDSADQPPDWLWAGVAIIPLVLMAFVVSVFVQSSIHSYRARIVERELAEMASADGHSPPMLLEHVNAAVTSNRSGLLPTRLIYWSAYVVLAGALISASIAGILQIENTLFRILVGTVALWFSAITIYYAASVMFDGPRWWRAVDAHTAASLRAPFPSDSGQPGPRSLFAHLLLPRANDLLVKGIFLHLASGVVGWLLVRTDPESVDLLGNVLVSVVLFEFVLYQGRYLLNDYYGQAEDLRSPSSRQRKRLPALRVPGDPLNPYRVFAFWASLVLRLAVGVLVFFLALPADYWLAMGVAIGAITATIGIYEVLRNVVRSADPTRYDGRAIGIYLTVGTSYGVRAALGVDIGTGGRASLFALLLVGATFYFSGLSTVVMVWALEATDYIFDTARRGIESLRTATGWTSLDGYSAGIGSKTHLLPLAVGAGLLRHDARPGVPTDLPYRRQAVLAADGRVAAPWNWTATLSLAFGAMGGVQLAAGLDRAADWRWLLGGLVVGLLTGVVMCRWQHAAFATIALGAGAAVVASSGQWRSPWFIPLPAVVATGTYLVTRQANYPQIVELVDDLKGVPPMLAEESRKLWAALFRPPATEPTSRDDA